MKRFSIIVLTFFVSFVLIVSSVIAAPKGKLVIGFPGEPTTYDPHTRTGGPMSQMWPMVFDTLLWRKASGEIVGNVASSWKLVNPKMLEFKIRKGIKFHNGEVLDAHAVKYSLDRIFEPKLKSRVKNFLRTIKNVEVVDNYTVRIHTKTPDGFILAPLADWGAIVPPKHYKSKKLKHLARFPVGSGPYKVVKWKKGSEIIYEAFPGYWNPARQKFKTGIIKFIPEPTTRVSALVSGAVDMVTQVPPQMTSMVKANKNYEAISYHGPKACSLIMVLKGDAPWSNVKVRQAVNYGIDKESIIKHVLLGYAIPSKATIVGPKSVGHNPDLKPYPYDLAKAKRLMKEAGYEKGFAVPLMVPIGRYLGGEKAAEAIAGQLKKLNITVKVKPLEYGAWRRNSRSKWTKGYPAYWNYACRNDSALHSAWMFGGILFSKSTHGGVRSEKLDKMITDARQTTDPKAQVKKYQELNRYVRENALLAFLYHLDEIVGKKKNVDWAPRSSGWDIPSEIGWKK